MRSEPRSDRLTSKPFPVGFHDPIYTVVNLAMGVKYFEGVKPLERIAREFLRAATEIDRSTNRKKGCSMSSIGTQAPTVWQDFTGE